MIVLAIGAGLLLGSLPTADLMARIWGVNLRTAGTQNPGARNALAVGGNGLGGAVLLTEFAKGVAAVSLGRWLNGDAGGAMAGIAATLGNVYNPWFRGRGGKGLGISGGVIVAAWPAMFVTLLIVMATGVAILRRSGPASLIAFGIYGVGAGIGLFTDFTWGWGMVSAEWLLVLALGSITVMIPKHLADTLRPADPPRSRRGRSPGHH